MHEYAIITGGCRGIGLAIARRLGAAGYSLIVTGRDPARLATAQKLLSDLTETVLPFRCDLRRETEVLDLFQRLDRRDIQVRVLINNAGVGIFKPLLETRTAEWDEVLAVNLRGAFLCAREAMRRMRANGGGRIINIGSVVSFKGYPSQGAYSASKHALLGLTKVIGAEGAPDGIIAQAVCPGGVDTEMVAASRPDLDRGQLITPDDVAEAVLFCLRQKGQAITDVVRLRRRNSAPFA